VQVGGVIVPTTGFVAGAGIEITTPDDGGEIHPVEFSTV
jgi:hypothetical protein